MIAPHWKAPVLLRKQDAAGRVVTTGPAVIGFELSEVEVRRRQAGDTAETGGRQDRRPVLQGYLAGLLAMVTYRLMGWVLLWRVASRSTRVRARLRESSDVVTPVAVGVLRPMVILPAGWRTWNANTKRGSALRHSQIWIGLWVIRTRNPDLSSGEAFGVLNRSGELG